MNNVFIIDGFLAMLANKEENTDPIPTPTPANPIVAKPAPISLAAWLSKLIMSVVAILCNIYRLL